MAQAEWSQQRRVMAVVGGAALTLYAFSRMALIRVALVGAGAALVARALTNVELSRLLDLGASRLRGLGSQMERTAAASARGGKRATREEPA